MSPKRLSSSRRYSAKRNSSKFGNKLGSFANYNDIKENSQLPQPSTFNNPKEIAQRLKRLYNMQIATFMSHITANADKHNH